jgi:HlyD family secretion protein/macrolide-specific efflux system membrane fusion protein
MCVAGAAGAYFAGPYVPKWIAALKGDAKAKGGKDDLEKSAWTTAKVKRGTLISSVSATGRVVANLDVDIKCKSSGTVMEVPKDVSDSVKKGDLLVKLDPIDEQRNVDQSTVALQVADAKLASAQEMLSVAELQLVTDRQHVKANIKSMEAASTYASLKADRFKTLVATGSSTKEEYDAAHAAAVQSEMDFENAKIKDDEMKTAEKALEVKRQDVKLAAANVESARIALKIANQKLTETTIYSPIDGVVAVRNVQIGQIISSGISNVGGGTTLLTVSDLNTIYMYASVDESDIGKVANDQEVNITADSYPGRNFKGKVVRVSTRGLNVSNVITFETRIEVTSPNKRLLKPEMTGNVEIIAARRDDTLMVPAEAVGRKQGKRFVLIPKEDGTNEEREVELGINDGTTFEVVKGLTDEESIVYKKGEGESKWRADGRPRGPMLFGGGGGRR